MVKMNCSEYKSALIDAARALQSPRADLQSHLDTCAKCRADFASQQRLTEALRIVRADAAVTLPPPAAELLLLAEFNRVRRKSAAPVRYRIAAGALAASLLAGWAGWTLLERRPAPAAKRPSVVIARTPIPAPTAPDVPKTVRAKRHKPAPAAPPAPTETLAENDAPFVPIPFTAPLAPYERADVVRVELPVSALIAAGLPVRVPDPAARARADLLVSEDGRARAVRLISVSDSVSYRSIR